MQQPRAPGVPIPGGFTIPTITGNLVQLLWDSPADWILLAGHHVYVGRTPGIYTERYEAPARDTSIVIKLAPGTYYFAVTAFNSNRESAKSNEVAATLVSP